MYTSYSSIANLSGVMFGVPDWPPTTWTLSYSVIEEGMQHRCRLHFEALKRDPNVAKVDFENYVGTPNVRFLHVTFVEGETQPWNRSLQHLNVQFNVAHQQAGQFTPATRASDQADAILYAYQSLAVASSTRALMEKYAVKPYTNLSAEYGSSDLWKAFVPPWTWKGNWIQERGTDLVFEVLRIEPGVSINTVNVSVRAWRSENFTIMTLDTLLKDFFPSAQPRDPDPWHQRLMGDDPF